MGDNIFSNIVSAFDFVKFLIENNNEQILYDTSVDGEIIEDVILLPLKIVLYPCSFMPLYFQDKDPIVLLRKIYEEKKKVGIVAKSGNKGFYHVGTLATVPKILNMNDSKAQVLFHGDRKFKILDSEVVNSNNIGNKKNDTILAKVQILSEKNVDCESKKYKAVVSVLRDLTFEIMKLHSNWPNEIKSFLTTNDNFKLLTYLLASGLDITLDKKQKILEAEDCIQRGELLIYYLKEEIEIIKLRKKIYDKAQENIMQKQKDYILKEQINILKKELNGKNESNNSEVIEETEISILRKKSKKKKFSNEARSFFEMNLNKAEKIQNISADYTVLINQAEFMLSLPWLSYSNNKIDIKKASTILDKNHYGMEKVKERILEYLSVLKLSGKNVGGQILCFYGPCGVGKTSLVKDIAKALGKGYVKISLGGVSDEAEIRGHRKTYVGAMAGRIIRGLQNLKYSDPVVILDEIDKLDSRHGDPASALLEVLDPNQNSSFVDHYLEVPYDLSKIIFIATANSLRTISRPLLDRLEIIEVQGYTLEEKIIIAKNYLIPANKEEHGLKKNSVLIPDDTISRIISFYTRESGVRELNRQIATIMRKISRKIVEKQKYNNSIEVNDLKDYLGVEKYDIDLAERINKPGIAIGLAWTEVGGDILFIESSCMLGTGKLTLSGSLGDVMKESAQIAFIYLKSNYFLFGINENVFTKCDFHIHVPDGATPKDGPSAGITLFITLLSLCIGKKVKSNLAMTGEMSLRGEVLPVGGIKEKVLAAKRAGINTIIMCSKNEKDVNEIKKEYISDMNFIYVDNISQVIDNAIEKY